MNGSNDQIATNGGGCTTLTLNGNGDTVTLPFFAINGQMTLTNGSAANPGPTNQLAFGIGVDPSSLWFKA